MNLLRLLILLGLLPASLSMDLPEADLYDGYIRTYREIAIREMERTGIPASIKLAQAILESNGGRSLLAMQARNHFGIKCGGAWNGPVYEIEDDEYDPSGNRLKSCFRVYRKDEASFIAHSEFLRDPAKANRYGFLFRIPSTDYRRWAQGLKQAGYATNPRYPDLLIDLIERYRLDQYDLVSPDALDKLAGISRINDIRLAHARPGETLEDIAVRNEISVDRLVRYNDNLIRPEGELGENTLVYLQPKRNAYRGKQQWHKVQPGETLAAISQMYGIRLAKLRSKNRIPDGFEPVPGERVRLRWKVSRSHTPRMVPREALPKVDPVPVTTPQTTPGPTNPATLPAPEPVKTPPPSPDTDTTEPVPAPRFHTVAPGETLWRIAKQYDLTVDQLKSLNRLDGDALKVGQKLRVNP